MFFLIHLEGKRRVKSFLAAHFGLYLGNFRVLGTGSKGKTKHKCVLVSFPVVRITLLDCT